MPTIEAGAIEDCPACHTRVIVCADLTCPACQADMRASSDDGQRRLTIGDGSILPQICAHCGEPADGFKQLDLARGVQDGGANRFERVVAALASMALLGRLLRVGAQQKVQVAVDVPTCGHCWGKPPLRPQHVNFAQGTVTLLVHRRLSEAVSALRAE